MARGSAEIWDRVAPMLSAIATRYGDAPCTAWLGPDGAGHFVKTVHNGIDYADMQLLADVYGAPRDGLGLPDREIAEIFAEWSAGPLASYLIEISA
ncbi:MAG: hypothetical protein AAF674_06660 [Pseudomonadota bacterium]